MSKTLPISIVTFCGFWLLVAALAPAGSALAQSAAPRPVAAPSADANGGPTENPAIRPLTPPAELGSGELESFGSSTRRLPAPPPFGSPAPLDIGTASIVPDGQVNQAMRQVNGDFDDINRSTGLPLGQIQPAWNNPEANKSLGQSQPGVVEFQWSKDLIMPIRLRSGLITSVVLPEWETVDTFWFGDEEFFEGKLAAMNTLLLRNRATGVDTTVTVRGGSGNLYVFYARGETINTARITDSLVYVNAAPVSENSDWFRKQGGLSAQSRAALQQRQVPSPMLNPNTPQGYAMPASAGNASAQGIETGAVNNPIPSPVPRSNTVGGASWYIPKHQMSFAHRMFEVHEGDRSIAPMYVYTNGLWTFLHYGEKAATVDMPVVYRLVNGVETLVNTRVIGDSNEVLVVEAVGDFVLRNGVRTVCLVRVQDHIDRSEFVNRVGPGTETGALAIGN